MQQARIVWFALLIAIGLYALVLTIQLARGNAAPAADVTMMRSVFMLLALGQIGVIAVLRRRLPPDDVVGSPAAVDPQAALTTYITCWALSESIALFGLVLGFIGRNADYATPFFVVSAALMLWLRPRAAHFGS